jgi:hypothetical protein
MGLSFFGTLYAVLELLRLKAAMKVYFSQGALLFEHNGEALVKGDPAFIQAVVDFEHYLLSSRREGHAEGLAAAEATGRRNTPKPPGGTPLPDERTEGGSAGAAPGAGAEAEMPEPRKAAPRPAPEAEGETPSRRNSSRRRR